jgi:geranylgeranyl diphosphate synthase type II
LEHEREIVTYLLTTATGKKGDARCIGEMIGTEESFSVRRRGVKELMHGIDGRIAYVFDRIIQGAVKVFFKRKDAIHPVYVTADGTDTIAFPSPDLGRDVVTDGDMEVFFCEGGHLEVETGVIDENEEVGLVGEDIFLATPECGEDNREMQKDGDEPHIGSVAIMAEADAALGAHKVSSHETETGLGIGVPECTHEVGSVEITGGFAGYKIVLHEANVAFAIFAGMIEYKEILGRIEGAIGALRFEGNPSGLFTPIVYALSSGGKRLRPALTLMACNVYSDEIEGALDAALAMEVFHNFTLLHDDLMDGSSIRRNRPTVHVQWDMNTAILSGDAMLVTAYKLIGKTEAQYLETVLSLFSQMAIDVCRGQQYDMDFEGRPQVDEEEYMEMIRLKTAFLPACCLKTGAILGGAPPEDADNLYDCGINLGLAFQLQDDLLDVYGDPAVFGKATGGDILAGKKTFLLVSALGRASDRQAAMLTEELQSVTVKPEEKIAAITRIYDELNIREQTEQQIQKFYNEALRRLDALSVPPVKTQILRDMYSHLLVRQS